VSAPEARIAELSRRDADHARPSLAERGAQAVSRFTGSTPAFAAALAVIVAWAASGPLFDYSPEWQLVVNTGTTVVTFLMVFVIQRAQNKEALAVQLKLNEIVAALEGASNRLINVESLGEEELATLHRHYARLVQLARKDNDLLRSHSVDEATARHGRKTRAAGARSRTR
jgi:low affinity Fe/Cu permease